MLIGQALDLVSRYDSLRNPLTSLGDYLDPELISRCLAAKWHLNRSQFGITIDHDLACFRSLIGILPVTPGINSFHHSLHCRV